jgi:hypothetical protein
MNFPDFRTLLRMVWVLAAANLCHPALVAAADPPSGNFVIRHEGTPVAGAQVNFPYGEAQRTDASGAIYLKSAFMMVRAEGFATEYWNRYSGAETNTQGMELARESVLTGRILDAGGQPLANATLKAAFEFDSATLFVMGLDPFAGTARTDVAGTFALHGLRAGRQYRIFIESEKLSVANGVRIVTAGGGPIDIVMNAAVPVTLAISGLRGPFPAKSARASAAFNKFFIQSELITQPDLVAATGVSNGPRAAILMDWLDPETGAWLPVFSPRHVKVKSATRADVRFEQVPVGTIRVQTTGGLRIVQQTFDPVTIRAGRRIVIPLQVTTLRKLQVRVIDQEGVLATGLRVEVGSADSQFSRHVSEESDGSLNFEIDPRYALSVRVIEADKVISMTPVPRKTAGFRPAVMVIRLKGRNPERN